MMKYLDLTFADAAQNLACDEALLENLERARSGDELLRLWWPERYFVVLGHGNRWRDEVVATTCAADGIPVLRRCSGGGAILQGPGCLNYSLFLRQDNFFNANVQAAFDFVLCRHRISVQALTSCAVSLRGHSDLALDERKFSGNAQYRKRDYVLVHGTFLLRFEIPRIARYLKLPVRQPDYRRQRDHGDFLINLEIAQDKLCLALRSAWGAEEPYATVPRDAIDRLTEERYRRAEWNEKF